MSTTIHRVLAVILLCTAAACTDQPVAIQPEKPDSTPAPLPLGVYEFTLTGMDGSEREGHPSGTSRQILPEGASLALNTAPAGLAYEFLSSSSVTEGGRGQDGHRYISATYRVRNMSGAPITNLTLIPAIRNTTIAGTAFTSLIRFNGTAASTAIASLVVPTGRVYIEGDHMLSPTQDVLQVFTEPEVAAITLPAGTTSLFPYGFVVRSAADPNSRTIPSTTNANEWGGLLTFTFRYPLQTTGNDDPFTIGFTTLAVLDTETRLTESIEEAQDTAAVRRLRQRATALGATTVTVLPGSPAADPFVTDYPGQRQICSVRTAGAPGAATRTITAAAAYTRLAVFRPGQSLDPCAAYFFGGTPVPAQYGMPYATTVRAMDRYGNLRTAAVDTVSLTSSDGSSTMPARTALSAGSATVNPTYITYGNSTLYATGRRLAASSPVFVNGMSRTWTGNVDTHWFTNGDWVQNMHPGVQDSVVIPGDRPRYPALVQNVTTAGLTMSPGSTAQPTVHLSSFDLTVNGDVALGTTGTFTGTGRLILSGSSATVGGGLSNFDVRNLRIIESGRYTASSNINVTGGRIVVQGGRLRNTSHRIRVRPS